ncbi:alpha/beta hydrolase [Paludibacterium paludis]|uniref:Alpha/beta hydrolase n=1 Tax=Paludibacterium paludis TaxID=1225769 RepID=A0A918UAW4_9NEIS|nr:alpha/beta hydrolase [Paludibacterium paludis]
MHFAHANSFPASTYRKMLARLGEHHHVGFMDTIGHDPAFPVTDGWPYLVDEAIQYIEEHYDAPVIGVGHSLGGIVLFYASIRRPDLFHALIILDSPLMGPFRSAGIWFAKRLGFIDRVTPGGNTLRRRDNWADVEMVRDYFARKSLFARFDADCLTDYAQAGTIATESGGRRLKFRPHVEHAIYCTLPHDYPKYRGRLSVPALFIAGAESDVLGERDIRWMRRHFAIEVDTQGGSHLFPLEHPVETADRILEWIPRLLGPRR